VWFNSDLVLILETRVLALVLESQVLILAADDLIST